MPISVTCPGCSAKMKAPDAAAGKKIKCPKCQGAIAVPALAAQPDFEVVEDEPVQPAKKLPFGAGAAKPKVKADVELDDDDEDDQPKKKLAKAVVEEDEEDDDEKPCKKQAKAVAEEDEDDEDEKPRKKRKQDDEDDDRPKKKKKKKQDEGGTPMVRNIIGGVVLLILLGVVGFVYYDKFGKKDKEETASSSSSGGGDPPVGPQTPAPQGPGPKRPGRPGPTGPGPNPVPNQPDPNPSEKPTPADARNWQPPPVEGEVFRITFPNDPRIWSATLNAVKADGNEYRSTGGENGGKGLQREIYHGGYIFIPNGATDADKKRLREAIISALSGNGYAADGKITRREVKVGGRTWEEVQFSRENHPLGIKGGTIVRLFEIPERIFFLMGTRSDGLPPADVLKRFFESFELVK